MDKIISIIKSMDSTDINVILTFSIGCFMVILARAQYRLAAQKLKWDLFSKRYEIYRATRTLCGNCVGAGVISKPQRASFLKDTRDANFFYGQDVTELLNKLMEITGKLSTIQLVILQVDRPPNIQEELEKKRCILDQISVIYEEIDKAIDPYLDFRKWS